MMKLHPQATPWHLLIGGILVLLGLIFALTGIWYSWDWCGFMVFFFGVWGGVELGRYLEHMLSKGAKEG